MNGIHDMGGMHGFGPIPIERDEPVFHADWEAEAMALRLAMAAWGKWNIDAGRHSIERFQPSEYLAMTYYERWITSLADLAVAAGLISLAEVESGRPALGHEKRKPPLDAAGVAEMVGRGRPADRSIDAPPRFAVGASVRTITDCPRWHTRLPRYARGHRGEIVLHHGAHVFPDQRSRFLGDNPRHLYAVRFAARELWGGQGGERDSVTLDLWESYLEDA